MTKLVVGDLKDEQLAAGTDSFGGELARRLTDAKARIAELEAEREEHRQWAQDAKRERDEARAELVKVRGMLQQLQSPGGHIIGCIAVEQQGCVPNCLAAKRLLAEKGESDAEV